MPFKILGRAFFYNGHIDIETWEHEFEPMTLSNRSGADWARSHLYECHDESSLRGLLEIPQEGNYQVLFKGEMDGGRVGYEYPEWDEWFNLEESKYEVIPKEYLEYLETKVIIGGGNG